MEYGPLSEPLMIKSLWGLLQVNWVIYGDYEPLAIDT